MLSKEVRGAYEMMHALMIDAMYHTPEPSTFKEDLDKLLPLCKLLNKLYFSHGYDTNQHLD